ncbi:MAG: MFS transporter, partial [Halobacteriales archaeon]|nr:MFS transporter [Halobacteriales archaeon]
RVPRGLFAPTLLTVAAATLAVVLLSGSVFIAVVGVVVFAAGLMAYPPVMQSYLMDTFPTDSMGGDLGAMRSIYIGLGAFGPTYVGAVTDAISITTAFAGLVVALVVSAGVILSLEVSG